MSEDKIKHNGEALRCYMEKKTFSKSPKDTNSVFRLDF